MVIEAPIVGVVWPAIGVGPAFLGDDSEITVGIALKTVEYAMPDIGAFRLFVKRFSLEALVTQPPSVGCHNTVGLHGKLVKLDVPAVGRHGGRLEQAGSGRQLLGRRGFNRYLKGSQTGRSGPRQGLRAQGRYKIRIL